MHPSRPPHRLHLFVAAAAALLIACSSDNTAPGGGTGSLSLSISGLPSGTVAAVDVTGPGGYSKSVTAGGVLSGLTAGTYTLTANRVTDVGLDYASPAATVAVAADAQATATVAYALRSLPRSTANRTDETASPKYRIMYVLPSDGVDRNLDTDGTMLRTISSWERWYASQTGGKHLRLDTSDGAPDITFARIARTDAVMTSYGDFIRDSLEKQLVAAGYSSPNTLLLVYYDGGHQSRCGSGAWPPALPGVLAALFLKGLAGSAFPCASNPFAASPTAAPGYLEFTAAHEALHLLGIVSPAAPNYSNQHVGNDPTDLMYAGALAWHPAVLDVTKTNYYNPAGLPAGLINLATSPYLVP